MMTTSDQEQIPQSRKIILWLLTAILWLATAGVGFLAILSFQDIVTTLIALLLSTTIEVGIVETRGWITTARNISTIVGGLFWLGVVVGGMEYHFRHVGERRSWRIFAWTLGIEIALILVSVLIF
ncbi:MAG: hypothetical protein CL610_21080 [Anaerolineaceae bacterium]|nr:hypothetical protein [Anaerolineaceae bacterium]